MLTIIANISLFFMRINDIFGKRIFKTKKRIFILFALCFLIEISGRFLFLGIFDIKPIDSAGWSGYISLVLLSLLPSKSGPREEMPIIEYKLPKKTITIITIITIIIFCFCLYSVNLVIKDINI
jgi:hypothetical protein